jgi:ABC-type lipoprotein export system ATPase subunit
VTVAEGAVSVEVEEVVKAYGTAAAPVHALRGVRLTLRRGERVALLGKSGSGKSTLLNLIGGLDRATSGRVWVNGRDLSRLSASELAAHRLTTVGMIFQAFNLVASRSALQNVELPMIFAGKPPKERQATARDALVHVGLGSRLHHRPNELSGGEMQRVAIARALVNRPSIVLADEPTGNLDTSTAADILTLLEAHLDQHSATLVLVTHEEDLARRTASRIVRLQDGQVIAGV